MPSPYVIEERDTLYSLSSKFDVPVQELVQLNNLHSAALIYEGRELLLPWQGPNINWAACYVSLSRDRGSRNHC